MMFGLTRKSDNVLEAVVATTDGYDLTQYNVISVPESADRMQWNPATSTWDAAASTPISDVRADQYWDTLSRATPAQIDTWLSANVTDLASARRVLKLILLALRAINYTRPIS